MSDRNPRKLLIFTVCSKACERFSVFLERSHSKSFLGKERAISALAAADIQEPARAVQVMQRFLHQRIGLEGILEAVFFL